MALRFETPVPNWRKVIFDCAQMVGKPVMTPEPAAKPIAAAPVLRSERRESPALFFVVLVMPIPLFRFGSVGSCVKTAECDRVFGVPGDRRHVADGDRRREEIGIVDDDREVVDAGTV